MTDGAFLAIDWGTTNRRVYRIAADGTLEATVRTDRGILAMVPAGYAAEVAAIRAEMGDLPILCAGMVGSNRGWAEVPYLPCPADIAGLASALHWVEPGRTAIVPGVAWHGADHADVMRGEEVQLLGATLAGLTPPTALLCQPGTHCKWAWMADGRIDRFTTAMTGEIFSLIQRHSLLSAQMTGTVEAGEAFLRGVADAGGPDGEGGDLLARLFGVRADFVTGRTPTGDEASYVSGLLIGTDVWARKPAEAPAIGLLADPVLGGLYSAAIAAAGGQSTLVDSHSAFIAGITHIWRHAA